MPSQPDVAALTQERTRLVNQQLLENVAKFLGVGAGVGLLARGAQGAVNIGRRTLSNPNALSPTVIGVPDWDEKKKTANFLGGENATHWTGHPLAVPATALAAGGGAFGGWKLMDYVLDKRRKQQLKEKLEATKQQYERALLSQYDKQASALGQDLDRLFAMLDAASEKQANPVPAPAPAAAAPPPGSSVMDMLGQATGAGLLGMGGVALLSGTVVHDLASKRRRQALLAKALRKRKRDKALAQPTRIFAIPQPLSPAGSLTAAPSEDDLAGNPLDKVAGTK